MMLYDAPTFATHTYAHLRTPTKNIDSETVNVKRILSMSDNFAILESSIVRSTIWKEDAETCKLWITILAIKNKDGEVHSSIDGLAHEARISEAKVVEVLEKFMLPELASRSQEHEGRRLLAIPRGWLVLGHARIVREFSVKKKQIRDAAWARKNRKKSVA